MSCFLRPPAHPFFILLTLGLLGELKQKALKRMIFVASGEHLKFFDHLVYISYNTACKNFKIIKPVIIYVVAQILSLALLCVIVSG